MLVLQSRCATRSLGSTEEQNFSPRCSSDPNNAALGNTTIETDESCAAQKEAFGDRNRFTEEGGMKTIGE